MLKLSAWISDLQVVSHSREQIFFFPLLVLDRNNFLCVWTGISITLPFPAGKYLPLGYKGDRGGRDHRTGQKEDGIGPPGDSAHGYHWPNGFGKQFWEVQVSARKVGEVADVNFTSSFRVIHSFFSWDALQQTLIRWLPGKDQAKTAGWHLDFILLSLFLLPLFFFFFWRISPPHVPSCLSCPPLWLFAFGSACAVRHSSSSGSCVLAIRLSLYCLGLLSSEAATGWIGSCSLLLVKMFVWRLPFLLKTKGYDRRIVKLQLALSGSTAISLREFPFSPNCWVSSSGAVLQFVLQVKSNEPFLIRWWWFPTKKKTRTEKACSFILDQRGGVWKFLVNNNLLN